MPRFSRNLWLLLLQNLAAFLGIAVQALILNLYLVAIGYREDFIGSLAFVQTAAIGVGALPASWLSSRIGPRRCLIVATVLLGASFGGMAVLEHDVPLLLASALSGLSMALVFVPSAPYLMENAGPDQRSSAFAANFAALSIASVVGSALGGILPGVVGGGEVAGYRAALVVGSALTALGALPMLVADDGRIALASTPIAPTSGPFRVHSIRRDLFAMSASTALLAAATGLIVAFFNVYLRDVVGAPTATIGTVFAAASLAMAPASLIGPAAARRWGNVRVISVARVATAPFVLALGLLPPSLLLGSSVYVLRAALISISQPLDNAFAMELVPPTLRARVAAIRTVAWNVAWAVATGLGGQAIVMGGYNPVFITSGLLILGSVVVHWVAFRGR